MRFGYTLEGQRIRGTSRNSQGGYEADMLDRAGMESHFEHVALPVIADGGCTGTHVLKYLHIDSYELGADVRGQQPTWSRKFREEFKSHRGYDLLLYLPALARRIVDSRDVTNRFLFDIRWTIGDLMAEQFWIPYGELAHQNGVEIESETGYGTYPYPHIDGLRCAGNNDLPMGEFWFGTDIMSQFDHGGMSSAPSLRPRTSTGGPWCRRNRSRRGPTGRNIPRSLKPVGDDAFLDGLNRMVFHQYTAQPLLNFKPGWQYGAGTHVDRNITWWEEARGFFTYIGRCSYMLQTGRFAADALYFYGEGVTKFLPSREYLKPALPQGYNFDAINADLLLHGLAVDHGEWTLPSDMRYRVLVLPEDGVMSPEVLQKIRDLVSEGGVVSGAQPCRQPGLRGYPGEDSRVRQIAREMWGDVDGVKIKERSFGKGRVYVGEPLGPVFAAEKIAPDFAYSSMDGAKLDFLHRTSPDSEVYFFVNRQDRDTQTECTFRVSGKKPEIWDPVTGQTHPVAFKQVDGHATISMEFEPHGSFFVVFHDAIRPDEPGTTEATAFAHYTREEALAGIWDVSFDPHWGGPAKVEFPKLLSWTERPEDGIKYYSGTATYRKTFDLPPALRGEGVKVAINLGEVKYVAQVRLNGKDLGPLWTKPFRVDITDAVKPMGNVLEIDVANLWPNRIIGDSRLPPDRRFTHTNIVYTVDTPLWKSGLLGPVTLEKMESADKRAQ